MDLSRIKNAFYEEGGAAASGTAATSGPGAIGGGVAPFKARWPEEQKEEFDPQAPGVVQSTQHASDAQLSNPMHETTHEEVNLFDEERIAFSETPLVPFSGLQAADFEVGINRTFEQIYKIVNYNLKTTTDPTNKEVHSLQNKLNSLKNKAEGQLEDVISTIEAGEVLDNEKEINLSDLIQVACLINAYGDNEDQEPQQYSIKQADRLIDIAKNDALDAAKEVLDTQTYVNQANPDDPLNNVEYLLPSNASRLIAALSAQKAIRAERWGEALFWNKLRKTIEVYNWSAEEKKRAQQQDAEEEEPSDVSDAPIEPPVAEVVE